MSIADNRTINSSQYILTVYKTQIGIGILSLPSVLANRSGTAGLLTPLLSWAITVLVSLAITRTMRVHPGLTFQQAMVRLLGRVAGNTVTAFFMVYSLLAGTVVLVTTIYVIQIWVLKDVPAYELALLLLVPIYMVSRMSGEGISRYAQFLYIATLWMYPMLLFPLQDATVLNMLPLFPEGPLPAFSSLPEVIYSYLGLEAGLFLFHRHASPEKAFRDLTVATTMTTLLYLLVTVICYLYFDQYQLMRHLWPTLELFKTVRFPFIERFELVFLPSYMTVIVFTTMSYFFICSQTGNALTGRPSGHRTILRVICLLPFLALLFFEPDDGIIKLCAAILNRMGLVAFAFPLVLWGIVVVKNRVVRRRLV